MTQQTSPFLEAAYGWSYGESGWADGMDSNLLKFSFLFNGNIDGIVSTLPAAANGSAYFLTTNNRLYFAVGTTWYSSPTPLWFQINIKSTGDVYRFNGTSLVKVDNAVQLDSRLDAVELTISTLGSAAFQDVDYVAYPIVRPSLYLNFAGSRLVDPSVTFTRASTATYFDQTGTLQVSQVDNPRIDYDPITGECLGILIEEQRTNLYTNSQVIGATSNVTVSSDSYLAPDGTMTADAVIETTENSEHFVQDRNISMVAGTAYTYSVFCKALGTGSARAIYLRIAANGNVFGGWFSPSTKAFNLIYGPIQAYGYQDLPNGWTRFWITFVASATATSVIRLQLIREGDGAVYTGDGVSGLVLWGAQFEAGAFPTSYIPTTSSQVTRAADVTSVNTLSPWINASSFTLIVSAIVPLGTPTGRLVTLEGSGITADSSFVNSSASSVSSEVYAGGVSKGTISIPRSSDYFTVGLSQDINDRSLSVNGSNVVMGAGPSAVPPFMRMRIGGLGGGANPSINGHITSIRYYPKRLTNAELQELTA